MLTQDGPIGPTVTVRLPSTFYDDHVARDLPAGLVVKRLSRHVDVQLDRESFEELASDANHYVESWAEYWTDHRGLVMSARTTAHILKNVEAPWEGTEHD